MRQQSMRKAFFCGWNMENYISALCFCTRGWCWRQHKPNFYKFVMKYCQRHWFSRVVKSLRTIPIEHAFRFVSYDESGQDNWELWLYGKTSALKSFPIKVTPKVVPRFSKQSTRKICVAQNSREKARTFAVCKHFDLLFKFHYLLFASMTLLCSKLFSFLQFKLSFCILSSGRISADDGYSLVLPREIIIQSESKVRLWLLTTYNLKCMQFELFLFYHVYKVGLAFFSRRKRIDGRLCQHKYEFVAL